MTHIITMQRTSVDQGVFIPVERYCDVSKPARKKIDPKFRFRPIINRIYESSLTSYCREE